MSQGVNARVGLLLSPSIILVFAEIPADIGRLRLAHCGGEVRKVSVLVGPIYLRKQIGRVSFKFAGRKSHVFDFYDCHTTSTTDDIPVLSVIRQRARNTIFVPSSSLRVRWRSALCERNDVRLHVISRPPWKGLTPDEEEIVLQDYFEDGSGKAPRYYQSNAINAAVEAIAKGQDRILLVMATGTGKTYTAFQIIWRLWKAGRKKRILFLADRNVLVDQTMVNDFRPFGAAMAKLSAGAKTIERNDGCEVELTTALDRKRRIDTAYEVYLGLYQAIAGPEDRQKLFREFSRGFFNLIVIDECHRGSAADDAAWREILEYFSAATQIGLRATPKETKYVSNIHYFGKPVYTYSLRQGIEDGFLAPYKVIKVHIDLDVQSYRPERGDTDRDGNEIEVASTTPKISTATSSLTTALSLLPRKYPIFSRRAETPSKKPSSFAWMRSMLRGCGRL